MSRQYGQLHHIGTSFNECIELALKGRKASHREASMEPLRFDCTQEQIGQLQAIRSGVGYTIDGQETAARPGAQ